MTLNDNEPYIPVNLDNDTEEKIFPDAFYDPITMKLMEDPVVISDGNSYERSGVVERRGDNIESGGKLYSNRALKAVISETVELGGDSFMPVMKQLHKTVQDSVKQMFEKSALSNKEFRPLSDVYYCPITFGLIHFPMIDPEGNTFEKVAIEAWILQNGSSPITRTSLSKDELYDNHAITALLEREKGKDTIHIHPSIRRFKEEDPPEAPAVTPKQQRMEARRYQIQRQRCRNITGWVFIPFILGFILVLYVIHFNKIHSISTT